MVGPDIHHAPSHGPQNRQITVLSCDLVNSVGLMLELGREKYSGLLNEFVRCIRDSVDAHGGYVYSTHGDCVYALFGYPAADETAAERAIRTALAVIAELRRNATFVDKMHVHVGIATSMVLIGSLSDRERQEAVGDAMNLVARIQKLGPPDTIMVSPETRSLVGEIFDFQALGSHELKGYREPIEVWQVLSEKSSGTRFSKLRDALKAPLIGRDTEWETLLDLWNQTQKGEGRTALISGESGIGKSRIVHEFTKEAGSDRADIVMLQYEPHLRHSHLAPVAAYISEQAGIVSGESDTEKLAKIERLACRLWHVDEHRASPLLAELLSVHSPKDEELPDLSSIGRLRLLLETLVELLTWRINSRPLLLVMEDLQWADDSSLELVDRLIEFATAEPVFLILTTRRLDIARLTENDNITNIPLPPLSTPDGAILVNALTSGPKLPSAQINAILDWSDGIPLDIEEHTRQEILDWLQRFEGLRELHAA
jgi:class 3 adenylate cyclase